MLDLVFQIYAQSNFTLAVCGLAAGLLSYSLASLLSSWLTGVVLFPGLFTGAMAGVEAAERMGMIIGRDKETVIIGACFTGLLVASLVYYVLHNLLQWLLSYNSKEFKDLMQRSGERT